MNHFYHLSKRELLLELFVANDVLLLALKQPAERQDAFQVEARLHLARIVAEMRRRVENRPAS